MPIITLFWLFLTLPAFATDGTFTDLRDGKEYRTVKIGKQVWMAENLNYEAEGSKCYKNKALYCDKYGRLYNWKTAMKACPKGWHLPSKEEWQTLVNFAGGDKTAGKKLKAKIGWNDYILCDYSYDEEYCKVKGAKRSGNGTDGFGFSALPGGEDSVGFFYDAGDYGYWWSSTKSSANKAYYRFMNYYNEDVGWSYYYYKDFLFSVRCLQD
jgi:uncharacterized protein (TIGR02145 family)